MYCTNLPPCPHPNKPIDGGWGPYGVWSECTAKCGSGFRLRRRRCDSPVPKNGGLECIGCSVDYEVCNTELCPEIQKMSAWTPWLRLNNDSSDIDAHVEKRFRYLCRVNGSDASSMKISKAKEENRVCQSDGLCHRDESDDSGWSDWSEWSKCKNGQQFRTRTCERNICEGTAKMARACNTQQPQLSCKGKYRTKPF